MQKNNPAISTSPKFAQLRKTNDYFLIHRKLQYLNAPNPLHSFSHTNHTQNTKFNINSN